MKGTSFSHTCAIDLMPPRMTTAVQAVITMPVIHGLTPKVSTTIAEIELACTMLPMPKAAIAVRVANTTPGQRGGERPEVADVAFALGRAREGEPDRGAEVALDETEPHGQVEVRADEEDEER